MLFLKVKVPLFMLIQQLVYFAKGSGCLWLDKLKDGVLSKKWTKYFVGVLIEAKIRPLDITR